MTTDIITQLEQQYEDFSANTLAIGTKLAASVKELQTTEVQESIANAVIAIEKVTHKEKSFFQKIPGIGKFITAAKETAKETSIREGNMVDVIDRLFKSLNKKKDTIVAVSESLYELKGQLETQVLGLIDQEVLVLELSNAKDETLETFKARNLLVQIQPTIIKAKDRIGVINVTIQSAQVSAQKIASMLPALHGELITEMSIQTGLQELKEFKEIFDATVEVVEELSHNNNISMNKVLLDVADLAVNKPTAKALARIENTNAERTKLAMEIKAIMAKGIKERESALVVLADARENQDGTLLLMAPGGITAPISRE